MSAEWSWLAFFAGVVVGGAVLCIAAVVHTVRAAEDHEPEHWR